MAPGVQHRPHGVLMGAWHDATACQVLILGRTSGRESGVFENFLWMVLIGASCNLTRPNSIPKSLYQKAPAFDADFFKLKLMPCGRSEPLAVWICVYIIILSTILYNMFMLDTIFLHYKMFRVYRSFPGKSILYWYYSRTGTALGPRFFQESVLSSLPRERWCLKTHQKRGHEMNLANPHGGWWIGWEGGSWCS